VKSKFVKIVFILSALFLFIGEHTLVFAFPELHEFVSGQHSNDIVIPVHHHIFDCSEEEACFVSVNFDFSGTEFKSPKVLLPVSIVLEELPSFIWQPPKLS
jgi:hypothetical protein